MTTYVYYNPYLTNHKSQPDMVRVTQAADGSWSGPTAISIDGSANSPYWDPSILILADGTYLLAYSTGVFGSGGLTAAGVAINTAVSTDGINFSGSRPAFSVSSTQQVSDPSIVQLADGSFLMSVGNMTAGHGVVFYSSADGRNFTPTSVTLSQSELAPDLLLLADGSVRLFTATSGGIGSFISHDNGHSWVSESGLRLTFPNSCSLSSVKQIGPSQWEMVAQVTIDPSGAGNPSNDKLILATSSDGVNFVLAQNGFEQQAGSPEIVVSPPYHNAVVPTIANTSGSQATLVVAGTNVNVLGAGYDIADLTQNAVASASSAYTLTSNGDGSVTVATTGSSALLSGVMQIAFSDKTVTIANSDNANLARLYQAAFGRSPDSGGLAAWENVYTSVSAGTKAAGAVTALALTPVSGSSSIADLFVASQEFRTLYGTNLSHSAFVNQVYQNVLHRTPDPSGAAAWTAVMDNGTYSQGMVLVGIAESAENISGTTYSASHTTGWLFGI
ncbi:MAG TPA: DUF4214 domain-containing protein [Rhodospirillaceae bacterium]|nr:DUF4214 domain-containing protein [Rhodospirillaceae bacterium]